MATSSDSGVRRRSRRALRESVLFDAALARSPAGASGQLATATPNHIFHIEFTGRSRIETLLDFRLQPGELLAAALLMRDRCDDCAFAAFSPEPCPADRRSP